MGPELASHHATDGLAWAQCSPYSMLPMVLHGPSTGRQSMLPMVLTGPNTGHNSVLPMILHGPSASHQASYQWSCMGPALATKCAIDDLVWAHRWPHSMLPMVLTGLSTGHNSVLPMILHGPSASHQACYQWSCMGPALATKHAIDDLVWAQR